MPPLEIPADLEEAIGKFSNVDLRDEAKLQAYSDIADLLSRYATNAKQYALYPRDTKEFAESINKSLRTLEIYLEMTTYNDAFTQCAIQWRETTEHIIEFATDLMKSLDVLRLKAATTSKPVSSRDTKVVATTVKPVLSGRTILPADERVTIVSEAFDKTGFLQVKTASGERVNVPAINLTAAGESTELLTFFTSSVEKMKQCLDQIRKEVASKFWAMARSYFQSRSKHELVTIADSKRWRQATDMLLKLDDNSTGFSFKSCINGILNNAIGRKLPDAFEITLDEAESLQDFVRLYQLLLDLLTQASGSLRSVDKLWGEDWQKSLLSASSLAIQSATDQQTGILQLQTALQGISNTSATTGQTFSEYRHLQSVQQQTTTKRIVTTTTNSFELNASSLEVHSQQQQQQQSYRSMRSADGLSQQIHRIDATDAAAAAEDDVHRVSRRSSVASESSDRWQQGQIRRGSGALASPSPSPVLMSARMESREPRRGIMDDSCSYEVKQRETKTMTDSVTIMSDDEVIEQRAQLQEARRLLSKLEFKAPKTETACQTDEALESVEQVQKSARLSARSQVTDAGCFSDWATVTSSARVGNESVDRLVQCHRDTPVTHCAANLEIGQKSDFVNYQQPQKTLVDNSASIGKVLIEQSVRFHEDRTVPISNTQASKSIDTVTLLVKAKVDYKAGNCRIQSAEVTNGGVQCHRDTPVSNCAANLEIGQKSDFVNYQQPQKTLIDNSARIGKVLIEQSVRFQEDRTVPISNTQASKSVDTVALLVNAKVDYKAGNCRIQSAEVANSGVKWQQEAVRSNMLSLGKPIVDNGVFRINELIDSWTDMPTRKPKESGAHYVQAKKDARTQKNPTRTPQVECGVGDNLYLNLNGGTDMSVQTAGTGGVIDCGVSVSGGDQGVSATDDGAARRRRTRGTDMSERHTICDTGVCASTNRVIKIVAEELALHRPRAPQQQQVQQQQQEPSKPERQPEPDKIPEEDNQLPEEEEEEEPVTQQRAPVEKQKPPPVQLLQQLQQLQHTYTVTPTTPRGRDVPDKEWRYPVHRQDFRPHQDTLPRPQLVFADTGQPLVPQSPTEPQPQTPQQQQPRHADTQKPRTYSLPRLHKRQPFRHQAQQPAQQQPAQQQPAQQQYPPQNQARSAPDNSKPGFARSQSTRNVGHPTSRSQLV